MDSTRWIRVQEIFHEVADRPGPEQQDMVQRACNGDESLVVDVLAIIEADRHAPPFLDGDVAQVANELLDGADGETVFPQRIGPYRLLKRLGEGGTGVVYLASRDDLGSEVAIKFLRDAWMSPSRFERFIDEQRTLAKLHHPAIAQLYDANVLEDGTPWFAMEYVDGIMLLEYCQQGRLSIRERLRLFRVLCEAVEYSHRNLVVHRDLKPSNVLVKSDGTLRLLDFGISKQLETTDQAGDRTRAGLRLMTPAYAAPEHIRGESAGFSIDVYSLGVILYELLTGRLPFDLSNRTPLEAQQIILNDQPQPPSITAGDLDLDVLCLTAMHRDTRRRYGSVEALIRDIDHYLKNEPLEARADSLRYRSAKFVRRNWRALSVTAMVLVVFASLAGLFTLRLNAARNEALAAAARTQRVQQFMIDLFEGGDKQAGPSDDLRVITLLGRGVQNAEMLRQEPEVQAELFHTLGVIYEQLGDLPRADSLLHAALDKRKSLHGDKNLQVIESRMALGLLRVNQGRFKEAEQLIREALDNAKSLGDRYPQAVARANAALGQSYEAEGKYAEAVPVLEEAVRLHTALAPSSPELSSTISELANTHFYAGNYDTSESLNQRALAMNRGLFGDRHPYIASDLINLGAIHFQRERYVEAEKLYRQALDIYRGWYGEDHFETAASLTMLGQTLVFQKRYSDATDSLAKALAIRERVYGPVHPRVASSLNEMGTLALKTGKLDEAESYFRRMVDIYKSVYNDRHYLISIALSNLASVYMERKQFRQAERLYQESLKRYADTLPAGHLNAAIARVKLGRVIAKQGRYREAERESYAAYEALLKQTVPPVSRLQDVRKDLVEIYTALGQPAKADYFRGELTSSRTRSKP